MQAAARAERDGDIAGLKDAEATRRSTGGALGLAEVELRAVYQSRVEATLDVYARASARREQEEAVRRAI